MSNSQTDFFTDLQIDQYNRQLDLTDRQTIWQTDRLNGETVK